MNLRQEIRFTLVTDGSSDAVLIHHLSWLLRQRTQLAIQPTWADFSRVRQLPGGLRAKIVMALDLYPCDLLFVHRDAEREPMEHRIAEIQQALAANTPPTVCVVPVRMSEAWLLFDEAAIRMAAGNPRGHMPLALPRLATVEHLPDPKHTLHEALLTASGLTGRRRQSFAVSPTIHRLGEVIEDFAPLRGLSAFAHLERNINDMVSAQRW